MKPFHGHVVTDDLAANIRFDSTLFGLPPTFEKSNCAKWMVDDSRVNFAVSSRLNARLDHLRLQKAEIAAEEQRGAARRQPSRPSRFGRPRAGRTDEFAQPGAPFMHFVFTVCDQAAAEACPVWPGKPMTAHWGVRDPAAVEGSDDAKRKAFRHAYAELSRRIASFVNLPLEELHGPALKAKLDEIGHTQSDENCTER